MDKGGGGCRQGRLAPALAPDSAANARQSGTVVPFPGLAPRLTSQPGPASSPGRGRGLEPARAREGACQRPGPLVAKRPQPAAGGPLCRQRPASLITQSYLQRVHVRVDGVQGAFRLGGLDEGVGVGGADLLHAAGGL